MAGAHCRNAHDVKIYIKTDVKISYVSTVAASPTFWKSASRSLSMSPALSSSILVLSWIEPSLTSTLITTHRMCSPTLNTVAMSVTNVRLTWDMCKSPSRSSRSMSRITAPNGFRETTMPSTTCPGASCPSLFSTLTRRFETTSLSFAALASSTFTSSAEPMSFDLSARSSGVSRQWLHGKKAGIDSSSTVAPAGPTRNTVDLYVASSWAMAATRFHATERCACAIETLTDSPFTPVTSASKVSPVSSSVKPCPFNRPFVTLGRRQTSSPCRYAGSGPPMSIV
mmetsp:Transcript_23738/g.49706  ORF Transcript_23738/g.49706 Transcript_23738/m.49706 type:complete len:283 (+) Transcript_23738:555-1403(+)